MGAPRESCEQNHGKIKSKGMSEGNIPYKCGREGKVRMVKGCGMCPFTEAK